MLVANLDTIKALYMVYATKGFPEILAKSMIPEKTPLTYKEAINMVSDSDVQLGSDKVCMAYIFSKM